MADLTTSGASLTKLTIKSFKDAKCTEASGLTDFVVMFNPTAYTTKYEAKYKEEQAQGNTAAAPKFEGIKPLDLTLEFIIDGTGTATDQVEVIDVIDNFLKVASEANKDTHRPHYLQLIWGTLNIKAVLKSADISYSLFKPNGHPLRAKINAAFTEQTEDGVRVRQERQASPDLTHLRKVTTDTKLPILTHKEYRNHEYYLSVARINKLNNFRKLPIGNTLVLPPITTEERTS